MTEFCLNPRVRSSLVQMPVLTSSVESLSSVLHEWLLDSSESLTESFGKLCRERAIPVNEKTALLQAFGCLKGDRSLDKETEKRALGIFLFLHGVFANPVKLVSEDSWPEKKIAYSHHGSLSDSSIAKFINENFKTINSLASVDSNDSESTALGLFFTSHLPIKIWSTIECTVVTRSPSVSVGPLQKRSVFVHDTEGESKCFESLVIANVKESTVYVSRNFSVISLENCYDCEVVVSKIAGIVNVTHCERVTVSVTTDALHISNSNDSVFNILTFTPPIIAGDSRGLLLGPYNVLTDFNIANQKYETRYANVWAKPLIATLGKEPFQILHPKRFRLRIDPSTTNKNCLPLLPEIYAKSVSCQRSSVLELRSKIASISDPESKETVKSVMRERFTEWLISKGSTN